MASITIRNIDDEVKSKLRIRAAINNRSMEEEVRVILKQVLLNPHDDSKSLVDIAREAVKPFGGFELEALNRDAICEEGS
jgi:antitoxin FitA